MMRRSHLYLTVSIAAMLVALSIGHMHENRCMFSARPIVKCGVAEPGAHQIYEMVIDGRFEAGAIAARRLVESMPDEPYPHLLLAYALRGAGEHQQAATHNRIALELGKRRTEGHWVVVDALTGKAASFLALGRIEEAREALTIATGLASGQEEREVSQRSAYQLACVEAQLAAWHDTTGNEAEALEARHRAVEWLQRAIGRGYRNYRHIHADLDLDPLRGHEDFSALCAFRCR